jgi:hypothetical protein
MIAASKKGGCSFLNTHPFNFFSSLPFIERCECLGLRLQFQQKQNQCLQYQHP